MSVEDCGQIGKQSTSKNKSGSCMKKLILAFLLGTVLMAIGSGCRTAHGFGEDMEKAGDKIQEKT
jgi:predicted small secreted protein